jgi:large subunit ribosomal protein L29
MKPAEIKGMTDSEIAGHITESQQLLSELRFNNFVSPIENPSRLRLLRKDIARFKTELTSRKLKAS